MVEIIIKSITWTVLIGFFAGMALSLIALVLFAFGLLSVALNGSILADIFNVIQIWLPFNLDELLVWVFTASGLYLSYKLAQLLFGYAKRFVD